MLEKSNPSDSRPVNLASRPSTNAGDTTLYFQFQFLPAIYFHLYLYGTLKPAKPR